MPYNPRTSTALIFMLTWIVGCVEPPPLFELDVDGLRRAYRLAVPTMPPAGEMPLLLVFQGGDGGDAPFPQEEEFRALGESEGVLIARPIARQLDGNEGAWLLNADATSRRDLEYVEAVIEDIAARHPVDRARIYATGYSLGSMFTYELACHLSTRFAAIASFAGTMPVSASCEPEEVVPIMHIHGVNDGIIPYAETWNWKDWDAVGAMRDVPSLVTFWKDTYECSSREERPSASSTHIVYGDCAEGARVEHHQLSRGGHFWPDEIDGTSTHEAIWRFVSSFSKR